MTQKKKKQHHPAHPPVPRIKKEIRKLRIISVAVIFFIIFGLGIAYFAGGSATALIAGGIIGAITGYFFGHQIVKGLLKN